MQDQIAYFQGSFIIPAQYCTPYWVFDTNLLVWKGMKTVWFLRFSDSDGE